jgi:hypothetical protein
VQVQASSFSRLLLVLALTFKLPRAKQADVLVEEDGVVDLRHPSHSMAAGRGAELIQDVVHRPSLGCCKLCVTLPLRATE